MWSFLSPNRIYALTRAGPCICCAINRFSPQHDAITRKIHFKSISAADTQLQLQPPLPIQHTANLIQQKSCNRVCCAYRLKLFLFFPLLYPSIVMEADDMSCQQKSNDGKRVEKVKVSSYKNINFEWVSQRQPNCMDLRTSRHQLMSFCAACWLPEASSFMAKIQRNETINREKAYGRGGACMSFRSFWWIH